MTLEELNSFDQDRFVKAVGWVFENSPWVAQRAWEHRPFASREILLEALVSQVQEATPEEKLALLCAHPDLGTRAAVSEASSGEQAGAGLDRLSPGEFERLSRLNLAYRAKFGFPFLLAVKRATKNTIFETLERRLNASTESERREALKQVYRIAEFRLRDSVKDAAK